jgi:anti-sigma factor ChrR (cupin superfamily)
MPAEPVLDEDLVAVLAAAVGPQPLDAAAHQRVKSRLLRRIAQEQLPRHTTISAEQGEWSELGAGLSLKVLHRDGDVMSYLVRMAPGSQLPPHRHPIDEECLVLEGAVRIGALRVAAGGFHLGHRDVLHDTIESPEGALIYLHGAAPAAALSL